MKQNMTYSKDEASGLGVQEARRRRVGAASGTQIHLTVRGWLVLSRNLLEFAPKRGVFVKSRGISGTLRGMKQVKRDQIGTGWKGRKWEGCRQNTLFDLVN